MDFGDLVFRLCKVIYDGLMIYGFDFMIFGGGIIDMRDFGVIESYKLKKVVVLLVSEVVEVSDLVFN